MLVFMRVKIKKYNLLYQRYEPDSTQTPFKQHIVITTCVLHLSLSGALIGKCGCASPDQELEPERVTVPESRKKEIFWSLEFFSTILGTLKGERESL